MYCRERSLRRVAALRMILLRQRSTDLGGMLRRSVLVPEIVVSSSILLGGACVPPFGLGACLALCIDGLRAVVIGDALGLFAPGYGYTLDVDILILVFYKNLRLVMLFIHIGNEF